MNEYITKNDNRFNHFFSKYENESGIICDQSSKSFLNNGDDYVCRFCGKQKPEVKFRKDAHVIPQLLGNRFLLSKFECDYCNNIFSKYENALAAYLGFYRTFAKIKGQKGRGIPKFKDQSTGFEVYLENDKVQMFVKNPDDEAIIDKEKNSIVLNVSKQTYIPINLYKCLLKIGLCLISKEEIIFYKMALKFLQDSKMDTSLAGFPIARLFEYFVPDSVYKFPAVFLYRRKSNINNPTFPTHTVLLFFQNYMYQIFIPFNDNDFHLYLNGKITFDLPIAPLILHKNVLPPGVTYNWDSIDLSSNEKKLKEPYNVILKFDKMNIS